LNSQIFPKESLYAGLKNHSYALVSRPCAMAGNFGFCGEIGLSGLDLFGSFGGNAKKNILQNSFL
jgi:hypothetical protein